MCLFRFTLVRMSAIFPPRKIEKREQKQLGVVLVFPF